MTFDFELAKKWAFSSKWPRVKNVFAVFIVTEKILFQFLTTFKKSYIAFDFKHFRSVEMPNQKNEKYVEFYWKNNAKHNTS